MDKKLRQIEEIENYPIIRDLARALIDTKIVELFINDAEWYNQVEFNFYR